MDSTKNLIFGREPVVVMALIQAFISAVVVFGLDLTMEQQTALIVLAGAVLTVIARQSVTPVGKLPEVVVGVQTEDGIEPAVMKAEVEGPKPRIIDNRAPQRTRRE